MPDPKPDPRRAIVLREINNVALVGTDVEITEVAAGRVLDALDAHDAGPEKP